MQVMCFQGSERLHMIRPVPNVVAPQFLARAGWRSLAPAGRSGLLTCIQGPFVKEDNPYLSESAPLIMHCRCI